MTPYFDPRWLVLMIVRTDGFQRVWSLVHRFSAPFPLNPVHHLILENALHRQLHDPDAKLVNAALDGLQRWRSRLAEQVFEIRAPDWLTAYRLATIWNQEDPGRPPAHGALLHVALARTEQATHLLSLDKEMRGLAKAKGLHVLPDRLEV